MGDIGYVYVIKKLLWWLQQMHKFFVSFHLHVQNVYCKPLNGRSVEQME